MNGKQFSEQFFLVVYKVTQVVILRSFDYVHTRHQGIHMYQPESRYCHGIKESGSRTSEIVHCTLSPKQAYTVLFHQSKSVCAKMFKMLHGIGECPRTINTW